MSIAPPPLSLADLEANDPGASARGSERRFLCPLPACASKQRGSEHRSLAANIETGAWVCHRCGESGKLMELRSPAISSRASRLAAARRAFSLDSRRDQDRPVPVTKRPNWERLRKGFGPIEGTPAAEYLVSRGIALSTASAAAYAPRWEHWERAEAEDRWVLNLTDRRVVFPIRNREGKLVAISARAIDPEYVEPKTKTIGPKSEGVFETQGARTAPLVYVTEAPIDALSLATVGRPAIALCGTTAPGWLRAELAFRRVCIATDNDDAGERAAPALAASLTLGSRCYRLRPERKDWNDDLVALGAEGLRRALEAAEAAIVERIS